MRKLRDLDVLYPSEPQPFAERVRDVVCAIPKGQTLSYSAVAAFAGRPGGARAVVRALHSLKDVPWWRVIRADGTVAQEVAIEQGRRLKREGVKLNGRRVAAAHRARARVKSPRGAS